MLLSDENDVDRLASINLDGIGYHGRGTAAICTITAPPLQIFESPFNTLLLEIDVSANYR